METRREELQAGVVDLHTWLAASEVTRMRVSVSSFPTRVEGKVSAAQWGYYVAPAGFGVTTPPTPPADDARPSRLNSIPAVLLVIFFFHYVCLFLFGYLFLFVDFFFSKLY